MRNKDLEEIWTSHWKQSVIDLAKKRYILADLVDGITEPADMLRFMILSNIYNYSFNKTRTFEETIVSQFRMNKFDEKELLLIYYFQNSFSKPFNDTLMATISHELYKKWHFASLSTNFSNFSKNHMIQLGKFMKNREGVRVILFLRRNRNYIGRVCLMDNSGNIVLEKNIQALSKGRENKPFYVPNGQTPTGIYSINSVMPKADQRELFGEFRRLKLDFVSREVIENDFDETLLEHHFWKEGIVANYLGRSLLRIHGTGLRNKNPFKKYHPFVTTSGCVSMCETNEVKGQRELLDMLMDDLGLSKTFQNEEKIQGTLAVVELDDQKGHVSLEDIKSLI